MLSGDDHHWMADALRLAAAVFPPPHPNPRVGCVLVRDGELVGRGAHHRAGGPHAEVEAIRDAGGAARGSTAYVTLEPCAHHGRTPPCVEALVEAGVVRVVAALRDPNPRVAGGGLERLAAAGIEVVDGLMSAEAAGQNRGFLQRMSHGRPWVTVKLAASLDGRTAMESGESRWITSAAARRDVHRRRAAASAVLTGSGTVLADDPRLTARDLEIPLPDARQPGRVVLDSRLRTPPSAALLAEPGPVLVFHVAGDSARRDALVEWGAEVVALPSAGGGIDLDAALRALAEREVNDLFVEAGPTLAGALTRAGLADELLIYLAPHLMGDAARPLMRLPGIETMDQRLPVSVTDVRRLGDALRITAAPMPVPE